MNEIERFLSEVNPNRTRQLGQRRNRRRPGQQRQQTDSHQPMYVICSNMGVIYQIHENGAIYRRSNVQTNNDIRINPTNAMRLFDEIKHSKISKN